MKDNKIQHPKKRVLLKAYAKSGSIEQAAKVAGVHRLTHYDWMKNDPDYAVAFRYAKEDYREKLEAEADRRAIDGVAEPIFDKNGNQIGERRKYSDTLLIFRLKGLAPEKYAERRRVDQKVNVSINKSFQDLSPADRIAELNRLMAIGESCRAPEPIGSLGEGLVEVETGPASHTGEEGCVKNYELYKKEVADSDCLD
jgi:hypothetical protein